MKASKISTDVTSALCVVCSRICHHYRIEMRSISLTQNGFFCLFLYIPRNNFATINLDSAVLSGVSFSDKLISSTLMHGTSVSLIEITFLKLAVNTQI